jgi:RluA family pseudouridine synthase
MMQWIVSQSEAGQKLVHFLKHKLGPNYSARHIKRGIENNLCKVNQRLEHFASSILMQGDKVSFESGALETQFKKAFAFSPADVLYENHELLIYNKPAGYASDGEEITQAMQAYGHGWELLHRLDRETTGLLMFTKGKAFREKMVEAFKTHEVEKVYWTIVDGIPHHPSGVIDNYLGKIHEYEGQALWGAVPSHQGHHAVTAWEVLEKGSQAALIRCFPMTGRTHQIRVHMSEMGYPILGDKQYGRTVRCHYLAPRCLLHAYELSFVHPSTQQKMHLQAPIPQDFKEAMEQLMGGMP